MSIALAGPRGLELPTRFLLGAIEGRFENVYASGGSGRARFGVFTSSANGTQMNDLELAGQQVPLAVMGGAQEVLTNLNILPGDKTVYGMLMYGNDPIIDHLMLGGGGGPCFVAGAAFVQNFARPVLLRGEIDGAGSLTQAVPIVVDPSSPNGPVGPSILVENTAFTDTEGDAELVNLMSAATAPTIVMGVRPTRVPPSRTTRISSPNRS